MVTVAVLVAGSALLVVAVALPASVLKNVNTDVLAAATSFANP